MTENEVLFQISGIVNGQLSFPLAVNQIAALLAREACGKGVLVDPQEGQDGPRFLDSMPQPHGSVYRIDLRDGGQRLGRVTLLFASDRFQEGFPQRLSEFVGEQLGMLLGRTRLAERTASLKRELAKMEEDLATRKLMQRAEGLLISRRGMLAIVARRWIEQQSHKSGLSKNDVADRVIAYYQATGLSKQKIA